MPKFERKMMVLNVLEGCGYPMRPTDIHRCCKLERATWTSESTLNYIDELVGSGKVLRVTAGGLDEGGLVESDNKDIRCYYIGTEAAEKFRI